MGFRTTIYCILRRSGHNIQSRSVKFNDFFTSVNHPFSSFSKGLGTWKLRGFQPIGGVEAETGPDERLAPVFQRFGNFRPIMKPRRGGRAGFRSDCVIGYRRYGEEK